MYRYLVTFEKTDQDTKITRDISLSSLSCLISDRIKYKGFDLSAVLAQIEKEGVYKGIHRNNIVTIRGVSMNYIVTDEEIKHGV